MILERKSNRLRYHFYLQIVILIYGAISIRIPIYYSTSIYPDTKDARRGTLTYVYLPRSDLFGLSGLNVFRHIHSNIQQLKMGVIFARFARFVDGRHPPQESINSADSTTDKDPFLIASQAFNKNKQNNYLAALLSLKKLRTNPEFKTNDVFFQALSTYNSLAGEHDSSAIIECERTNSGNKLFSKSANNEKKDYLNITRNRTWTDSIKMVDAKNYLTSVLNGKRVVMINESHTNYQHRFFLNDLLPNLYRVGFRILAIETLSFKDTLLSNRGFPIVKTGFYSREPTFGNLIRTAISLGFKILPYEDTLFCSSNNCLNSRDLHQAENLKKILTRHPGERMIVFAGLQHIMKQTKDGWTHMAEYFERITSIPVYCVDQVSFSEMKCNLQNSKSVNQLKTRFNPYTASVFLDSVKHPWSDHAIPKYYDVKVYHPYQPDLYSHSTQKNKTLYTLRFSLPVTINPTILQLFSKKEWDLVKTEAVPVFQKVFESRNINLGIYLPKDDYLLIQRNPEGEIIFKKDF